MHRSSTSGACAPALLTGVRPRGACDAGSAANLWTAFAMLDTRGLLLARACSSGRQRWQVTRLGASETPNHRGTL